MPRGYRKERTSVHRLHYRFIWCPKSSKAQLCVPRGIEDPAQYRKSVLTGEAKDRLEELIGEKADDIEAQTGQ